MSSKVPASWTSRWKKSRVFLPFENEVFRRWNDNMYVEEEEEDDSERTFILTKSDDRKEQKKQLSPRFPA